MTYSFIIDTIFNSKLYKAFFFILIGTFIFFFSNNFGMFWDNVLFASKMGNQLYHDSFFNWYIPDSFDPGHPPFLGFLLAISWTIFAHDLWSSHLVMLPFIIGLLFQIYQFISYYIKNNKLVIFAFLLLLIDPTLSAQLVLVNPEIPSLFFLFLSINSILYNRFYLKIIALFFLSIVSYRSMMLAGGVFLFDFFNQLIINRKKIKSIFNLDFVIAYFIGSLSAVSYLIWRLLLKGWLQTHENSPWESFWHFASLKEFLLNIIIYIQRHIDFGRIFVFSFILFSLYKYKKEFFNKSINQLIILALSLTFFVSTTSLLATNTMGHRYFITSYLIAILISFITIDRFYSRKKLIYSFLFIGLITGNLWIYPRNISQGWDASLAHIPYHSLRIKAIEYLEKNNIDIEKTATFFPNATVIDNIDLSGNLSKFEKYNSTNKYIFYSNVYNLSDKIYKNLDINYRIIKKFEKSRVHIYIYKRNNYDNFRRKKNIQ